MAEFRWWAVPTLHFLLYILLLLSTGIFIMTDSIRFLETRELLSNFIEDYLVVCPNCGNCAQVIPLDRDRQNQFDPRRVICQSCSYSKDWQGSSMGIGSAHDGYFNLPLWLQIEVGDRLLWFHNLRHLQYIEAFVSATLRERRTDIHGCRNASVISRLPNWVKAAKNRKHILKAIDRIKQK